MIKSIVISICLIGNTVLANPINQGALANDKIQHFAVSYMLHTLLYGTMGKAIKIDRTDAIIWSAGVILLLGIYKEAVDNVKTQNGFDFGDLSANALGIGTSSLFIWAFDF